MKSINELHTTTTTTTTTVESESCNAVAINQKDLNPIRNEFLFTPPKIFCDWAKTRINVEADIIMVYLLFNITCTLFPAALYMYAYPSNWFGMCYLIFLYFTYIQRFALMLHFSEHKKLFKKEDKIYNIFAPYFVTPFFGIPSGLYFYHHLIMHHKENNIFPWDISSTEPYQRDNPLSFVTYFLYWITGIWFLLPYHLYKRKQYNMLKTFLCYLSIYWCSLTILYILNPQATIFVFFLPLLITQFLFAFGNYSQHIFIDPKRSKNNFCLSYQMINNSDNTRTFNDGYHVSHHIDSGLHWTKLPMKFLQNIDTYAEQDCIVFHTLGYFEVGLMVMSHQWKWLASYYVNIRKITRTEKEVIELLKERCVPIYNSN